MYMAIDIVQPKIFRARIDSVLGALVTDAGARVAGEHFADRNAAKSAAHAEFMWAAGKNGRLQAQAAWKRALNLDNPSATELALLARSLYVCPTWLLTGKLAFINAELFADYCLCWETPRSQHFVYYGATEPGSALEYNPECLVHAGSDRAQAQTNAVLPEACTNWAALRDQWRATAALPPRKILDLSNIAGATSFAEPLTLDLTERVQARFRLAHTTSSSTESL